jgi:hypothetical protein
VKICPEATVVVVDALVDVIILMLVEPLPATIFA